MTRPAMRNSGLASPNRNEEDYIVARRIAAAVLLQAQKDIHSPWPYGCGQRQSVEHEHDVARAWVRSNRTGWGPETGCTFRSCCDLLELSTAATRKRVLNFAPVRVTVDATVEDADE